MSIAKFGVCSNSEGVIATIKASFGEQVAEAQLMGKDPTGVGIKIELENIDLTSQRSQWVGNVLKIAARHPSIRRYLGLKSEGFPGQGTKHFRLLLAEVVADAVIRKALSSFERDGEYDGEIRDWDFYYSEYHKMMSKFLPDAHKLQLPEP